MSDYYRNRNYRISVSPIVSITRTGHKYHYRYHYHGRNYKITLYEATEKEYLPCAVCSPPYTEKLVKKPNWFMYHWIITPILITMMFVGIQAHFKKGIIEGEIKGADIES